MSSINFTTRGRFTGAAISIATAGRFKKTTIFQRIARWVFTTFARPFSFIIKSN